MKETINYTELVKQAANGDNAAFEELYRASVKGAFHTASLILSNTSDAEDVVQNAYIKAAKKLSELKNPESFENWLKSIVENECKNYIRKEKRIIAPFISLKNKAEDDLKEPAEAVPQEIMEREDLKKSVTDILNSLSPETRACIVLFHYEDKSINEISEILNIPVGTVKSRLYNGRKKIEKQFDKLRKKDPTLYSIGAIPVLLSFLAYEVKSFAMPAALSSAAAVSAGATVSSTASAAASTAATTAATTAGTTASVTAVSATTATAVAAKVTAIAVAGTLAVGGTAVIKNRIEKAAEQTTAYSSKAEEAGTATPSEIYSSENFSEETNTESTSAQNALNLHTASQALTVSTSSRNNEISVMQKNETHQTTFLTTATTQKPTETTDKSTSAVKATDVTEPVTETTANRTTEATQPPTTNPENNYSSSSGVITEYTGTDARVSIPATIGGNSVTAIGADAFQGNSHLTAISMPNTVTQIGQEAFADCISLSSVTLPSSLKQIGIGAFYGCSSLSSVTIPNSVTTISDEAFANCTALKTVTIPSSVTDISDDAFSGCDSLTIICSEGSAAHKFAVSNSIEYTIL